MFNLCIFIMTPDLTQDPPRLLDRFVIPLQYDKTLNRIEQDCLSLNTFVFDVQTNPENSYRTVFRETQYCILSSYAITYTTLAVYTL